MECVKTLCVLGILFGVTEAQFPRLFNDINSLMAPSFGSNPQPSFYQPMAQNPPASSATSQSQSNKTLRQILLEKAQAQQMQATMQSNMNAGMNADPFDIFGTGSTGSDPFGFGANVFGPPPAPLSPQEQMRQNIQLMRFMAAGADAPDPVATLPGQPRRPPPKTALQRVQELERQYAALQRQASRPRPQRPIPVRQTYQPPPYQNREPFTDFRMEGTPVGPPPTGGRPSNPTPSEPTPPTNTGPQKGPPPPSYMQRQSQSSGNVAPAPHLAEAVQPQISNVAIDPRKQHPAVLDRQSAVTPKPKKNNQGQAKEPAEPVEVEPQNVAQHKAEATPKKTKSPSRKPRRTRPSDIPKSKLASMEPTKTKTKSGKRPSDILPVNSVQVTNTGSAYNNPPIDKSNQMSSGTNYQTSSAALSQNYPPSSTNWPSGQQLPNTNQYPPQPASSSNSWPVRINNNWQIPPRKSINNWPTSSTTTKSSNSWPTPALTSRRSNSWPTALSAPRSSNSWPNPPASSRNIIRPTPSAPRSSNNWPTAPSQRNNNWLSPSPAPSSNNNWPTAPAPQLQNSSAQPTVQEILRSLPPNTPTNLQQIIAALVANNARTGPTSVPRGLNRNAPPPLVPTIPRNARQLMRNTGFQRQIRTNNPFGGPLPLANRADVAADRADLMADHMDNLQSLSPLQRMLNSGRGMGMGMGMPGAPGGMIGMPSGQGELGGIVGMARRRALAEMAGNLPGMGMTGLSMPNIGLGMGMPGDIVGMARRAALAEMGGSLPTLGMTLPGMGVNIPLTNSGIPYRWNVPDFSAGQTGAAATAANNANVGSSRRV